MINFQRNKLWNGCKKQKKTNEMKTRYIFDIVNSTMKAEDDDPHYILLSKTGDEYKVFGTYDLLREMTNEINKKLDEAKERLKKEIMKP